MAVWRNQISLKKHLSNETTDEKTLELSNILLFELKRVKKNEEKVLERMQENSQKKLVSENLSYALFNLDEIIDEFEWIKDSIEKKENSSDYSYENWCEAFNEYLRQLYDLADSIVAPGVFGKEEKFLWIA